MIDGRVSIPPAEAEALRGWVEREDAVTTIEIGLGYRGGGVVFLDDYQLPAIEKAVRFCATNLGWAVEEESREDELHNWVVLRTPGEPVERGFDYFVDF